MNSEQSNPTLPLVLGTVQLGMNYGVANRTGQPVIAQSIAMVETAWTQGIRYFDTAQSYGESERVLGCAFKALHIENEARVVSKLSIDASASQLNKLVCNSVQNSIENLGVPRLEGLLVHNAAGIRSWHNGLGLSLLEMQRVGLTKYIGASIYTAEEAATCLDNLDISMLQLPFNIFDQNAYQKNIFTLARKRGCILHVRSIFLQGLLLMEPAEFPPFLKSAVPLATKFADLCRRVGLSKKIVALAYAYWRSRPFPLVVGADTPSQVLENCENMKFVLTFGEDCLGQLACQIDNEFWVQDTTIVNPAHWGALP
jgi:aryl-alcohol dehydrogenase-like predicted oxidoreductase